MLLKPFFWFLRVIVLIYKIENKTKLFHIIVSAWLNFMNWCETCTSQISVIYCLPWQGWDNQILINLLVFSSCKLCFQLHLLNSEHISIIKLSEIDQGIPSHWRKQKLIKFIVLRDSSFNHLFFHHICSLKHA